MDYGEYNHRRLYGRGGLSDQLSSAVAGTRGLRGLGDLTPYQQALAYARNQNLIAPQFVHILTPEERAAAAQGDTPPAVSTSPAPAGFDCECAVRNIGVDDATAANLVTLCQNNPGAFAQQMQNQGLDIGCREWYQEPRNIAIGVGVVAIGALIWWAL